MLSKGKISDQAVAFIKRSRRLLYQQFASDNVCAKEENPVSLFMAGSPGAGKTEFSKNLITNTGIKVVRIDADDIKDIIPQYTGKNSMQIQGASSLGVQYLYDYVLKKKKSVLVDGTFAIFDRSCENIERSLKRGRHVEIYYIYQDPLIAWEFTQIREALDGRVVPKSAFVESLFKARDNVTKVKEMFGDRVQINVVVKDYTNESGKVYLDAKTIDRYVEMSYDVTSLTKKL